MSICKSLSPSISKNNEDENSTKCPSELCNLDHLQSGSFNQLRLSTPLFEHIQPPDIEHELNVATSIIQQGSLITGDNLFDHLADIIKLVIKERPENIIDYFEELSFNMREQKLRIPENFPWTHFEPIDVERAKSFMKLMNLPYQPNDNEYDVCKENTTHNAKKPSHATQTTNYSIEKLQRKLSLNENVQRLHLYWSLCGFGLSNDEVYKLSYALQKIQFHKDIQNGRFWGIIYGLKKSYYIVEAQLTQSEIDIRFDKMREEVMEKISAFQDKKAKGMNKEKDENLIPGTRWQNRLEEDLEKMKPPCEAIPTLKNCVIFDIPPEPVGTGLNRRTYFVVNSLIDEWIELPTIDPQQVLISRKIKKFLTGELDADVVSYPAFPGSEKHYLRTIIARITSGTYVAPRNYYRRLTKNETLELYGENMQLIEEVEVDESVDEGEEEELDNDAIIIENEEYKPCPKKLMFSKSWVHVRPNILEQGRIAYFDEKKALDALENGSYISVISEEQIQEEAIEEEEEMSETDESNIHESGRALFTTCNDDKNKENVESWSIRTSRTHNKLNQLIILRSNLWPGAYSYTFEKYSDSIYFGWGLKYTARNLSTEQIPPIQGENDTRGLNEVSDPTVEMERAWRLFHEKNQIRAINEETIEEEESC